MHRRSSVQRLVSSTSMSCPAQSLYPAHNDWRFPRGCWQVGLVLDVVLVSLMAPAAVLGGVSRAAMSNSECVQRMQVLSTT